MLMIIFSAFYAITLFAQIAFCLIATTEEKKKNKEEYYVSDVLFVNAYYAKKVITWATIGFSILIVYDFYKFGA